MNENLYSRFCQTLKRSPSKTAIVEAATGVSCTFRQLQDAVMEKVEAYQLDHYKSGSVALLQMPNSIQWVATFLALQSRKIIVLSLDVDTPPATTQQLAQAARAALVLGADVPASPDPVARRGNYCLIKATSGTTGLPKLYPFRAEQMLADGRTIFAGMELRREDINFVQIPLGHSYGLGSLVIPLIEFGMGMVIGQSIYPASLRSDIERWQATIFPTVPALLRGLLESGEAARLPECLRLIISAGSPLPAELACGFAAASGRRIRNFYGSSETGSICYDRSGEAGMKGRSVGSSLPGVKIEISPRSQRIRINSKATFKGEFLLQDRGYIDPMGELVLLGRTDRQIKIGARRISLVEIERAVCSLKGVESCWVTSVERPGGEPRLAAVIISKETGRNWTAEMRKILPKWKCPQLVRTLPHMPVSTRGKPDRSALKRCLNLNQ